jgi:hypothetical protein
MTERVANHLFIVAFIEAFIVCQDYTPPKDYVPNMGDPMLDLGMSASLTKALCGPTEP